jgi:raffinose/stachyose/melibiose transport system substrate-binding protein
MIPLPKPRWRKAITGWNVVAAVLLALAVGISLWQVSHVERSLYSADVAVVRISHWQLELGYRDALQTIIDDYNRMQAERFARGEIKKRVTVVQVPVSEKIYGQLINTHLIAGTAPDIIEMGMASMISGAYRAQYFLSLSPEIEKPNPYNAPAHQSKDLASDVAALLPAMPWRDTFLDGLAGGFDQELQGYYSVPTTFAPWNRYAVNLDMLKEATGSDQMPKTLGQFLAACDKMRELGRRQGREIWPIAGSSYSANFYYNYAVPFMSAAQRRLDADRDGSVSIFEALRGLQIGAWSFDQPAFGDFLDALRAVSSNFPNGFLGMDREGAMLMFTQRQSGFLYTGAWDAGTVYRLAEGKFRVGIMTNVLPSAGERWGPLTGVNEASMTAICSYGINKTSAHVDIALDFLKYWTSQAQNQRFNAEADWVPCIIGSKVPKHMAAYAPQIDGYAGNSAWLFSWGEAEQLSNIFDGKVRALLTGRGAKEDVILAMKSAANDPNYGVDAVLAKKDEDARSTERNAERGIAAQALAQLLSPASAAPMKNYAILVSAQAEQLNGRAPLASRRCLEEAFR